MEKSILSCEELHSFLRSCNYDCMTAYEKDIDPIHYFLFVRTEREKLRLDELIGGRRLEGDYPSGRLIRVIPLGEMISRKWLDDVFSRSVQGVMFREDFMILGLAYNLARCLHNSFIRMNLAVNLGIDYTEESLYSFICRYMKESGYRVKLPFVISERRRFISFCRQYDLLGFADKIQVLWLYVKRKAYILATRHKDSETDSEAGINEHRRNVQDFIDFTVRELNISGSCEILDQGKNIYGCCFIHAGDIFVKGNEYTARTNSFRTEVNEQKKLEGLSDEDKALFICMKSYYDGEKKYIVYPFVEGVTLSSHKGFSREQLDKLGDFMLKALDILYKLGIVHRDFTSWNIMCEGDRFRLFDFGCAYSGEPDMLGSDKKHDAAIKSGLTGSYRYSQRIRDDAASAYMTYLYCGGSPEDECAVKIKSLIGRLYKA